MLTGVPSRIITLVALAQRLRGPGMADVVVTGCVLGDMTAGGVETTLRRDPPHRTIATRLPIRPRSTGELFIGLVAVQHCKWRSLAEPCTLAPRNTVPLSQRTDLAGDMASKILPHLLGTAKLTVVQHGSRTDVDDHVRLSMCDRPK